MDSLLVAHSYLLMLLVFGALEASIGKSPRGTDREETILDAVSIAISVLIRPIAFVAVFLGAEFVAPAQRDALIDLSWPAWLVIYLVGEDMLQYWWHRLGHTAFGWPWHRAHHSAPYMGARITFRNGLLYSFFMPNLWTNVLFVYLGAGPFALIYTTIKQIVVIASHSEIRWDQWLYRSRLLAPLAWIVERTLSTPATHFAHHALREGDGVGHYSGNFGNLLFVWDMLFGTALITRKYPPAFGVENDLDHGRERWFVQLFYPLFTSRRAESDFAEPAPWLRRRRAAVVERAAAD
jgi:sterol desaturase/sphingolipid hydroxylase (fatty acid hydroxylase superfamily)